MEQEEHRPEKTQDQRTLNRRQLLKAIAAAGGAVAAATMLPGEWAKPVVEMGVLPAHAQVTGPQPEMSNFTVWQTDLCTTEQEELGTTVGFSFDYTNAMNGIQMISLHFNEQLFEITPGDLNSQGGDPSSGTHYTEEIAGFCLPLIQGCYDVTAYFTDYADRKSNEQTDDLCPDLPQ